MKNPSKNYGTADMQAGEKSTGYKVPTYTGGKTGYGEGNRGNAPSKAPACYGGGSSGTGKSAPMPPMPKSAGK